MFFIQCVWCDLLRSPEVKLIILSDRRPIISCNCFMVTMALLRAWNHVPTVADPKGAIAPLDYMKKHFFSDLSWFLQPFIKKVWMTTKNFRVKIRKYSHDPIKIAPLTDSLDPPLCPHDAYRKNFFLDLTVDQWSTSKVYQFNLQFQGTVLIWIMKFQEFRTRFKYMNRKIFISTLSKCSISSLCSKYCHK